MKRTIYLPDDLAERVESYLREHPGLKLSSLVQEALERRLAPSNPDALLDLIGLVPRASTTAARHAEDEVVRRQR